MSGLELALAERSLAAFLLAVARTAGFVLVAPPFSTRGVPARVRSATVLFLAFPVATAFGSDVPDLGSPALAGLVGTQVLLGATLGFAVLLAVTAVGMAGDFIDIVGGFMMTQSMDPLMLTQTSVMGKLHQMTAMTLLMATDGHMLVYQGLVRTTQLAPFAGPGPGDVARAFAELFGQTCVAAVQIVAPVLAAVVITDIALGLLARAAPALNAFSLGFPLKILFTLMLVGVVVTHVPTALEAVVHDGLSVGVALFRS